MERSEVVQAESILHMRKEKVPIKRERERESNTARQVADVRRRQGAVVLGWTEHNGSRQEQAGKGTDQGQRHVL